MKNKSTQHTDYLYIEQYKIIIVHAKMGAGKTTFIRTLVKDYIKRKKLPKSSVRSPTYCLVNSYANDKILHLDLYRLNQERVIAFITELLDLYNDSILMIETDSREKIQSIIQSFDLPIYIVQILNYKVSLVDRSFYL